MPVGLSTAATRLGGFAHDPYALAAIVAEADSPTRQPPEVLG